MPAKYHNIRDSYKTYVKEVDTSVTLPVFLKIVNGFMLFLVQKLFLKGDIALPERLGTLQILGKKVKATMKDGKISGLAPDWAGTKKLWEEDPEAKLEKRLAYHFNEGTNGIRYRLFWSKTRVLVSNKTLYSFRFTRNNKRVLSSLVKQGKEYLIKN